MSNKLGFSNVADHIIKNKHSITDFEINLKIIKITKESNNDKKLDILKNTIFINVKRNQFNQPADRV